MHSFQILLLVVIILEIIVCIINIFGGIFGRKTKLHYNIAAFFMIIGQACLFSLKDWKKMDHSFVYLNECQLLEKNNRAKCSPYNTVRPPIPGIDEGIISIHDLTIYQSLVMLLIYFFTIVHCLYAANRSIYDHSIKWIEYAISSSLQTMLLYSLFGQTAQVIWVVVGLKMFAMIMSYGIELTLVYKEENSLLAKFIMNKSELFFIMSFLIYFFFHYGPLFMRKYSKEKLINGKVQMLESTNLNIWVFIFFASVIISEGIFPYLIYKNRENINSGDADVDFCLLSMISKITFNSGLLIGLINKDANKTWIMVGIIGAIWVAGAIIYYFVKRFTKYTSDDLSKPFQKMKTVNNSKNKKNCIYN